MSFKESIIIPLSLFKQCNFQTTKLSTSILENYDLPLDVRMKMHSQQKHLDPKKASRAMVPIPPAIGIDDIVREITTTNQPHVKAILERMKDHDLKWNDAGEIILGGEVIQNSNIIDIMKALSKSTTIISDRDLPKGTGVLYQKLIDIGVPTSWIRLSFPRRTGRRREKSRRLSWEFL